jgi:hypothetical protein
MQDAFSLALLNVGLDEPREYVESRETVRLLRVPLPRAKAVSRLGSITFCESNIGYPESEPVRSAGCVGTISGPPIGQLIRSVVDLLRHSFLIVSVICRR